MTTAVVSKTAETNAVSTYFVSRLAGPRIGKRRVEKGEPVAMTEYQARALLASGALVADKALVDDPFGEAAAEADKAKAASDEAARVAAEQEAAQTKAAADAAAEAARAAAEKVDHPTDVHPAADPPVDPAPAH